jgi:hypothetical protein
VKETINSDAKAQPGYEREFDIIVKIEDITADCPQKDKTELKITDNTNMLFDVNLDTSVLPSGV